LKPCPAGVPSFVSIRELLPHSKSFSCSARLSGLTKL
jgi:hypothetical protein